MNSFHELVRHRRSYRKFTSEPIDPDQVRLILEAALMAPAGKRRNPWHFVVVENRETLAALSRAKDQGAAPLAEAPLAVAVTAHPMASDTWVEDLSIATILMQLQAADLGLGSVWIQMRDREDSDGTPATYHCARLLGLPEGYEVLDVLAIGHPAEERRPYDTDRLMWERVHIETFQSPEQS